MLILNVIVKKLVVGPIASNCYIVGSEESKEGIIIDPGADAYDILAAVEKAGLAIKLIILTHRHPDHVGAATQVKQMTGAEVASHPECARYLPQSPSYMYEPPYEGAPRPERVLEEGDSIDVGGLHFTVIHTPGHTPCGISIYGEGHVFTGDTLFVGAVGRTDLPHSSMDQFMDSIKHRLLTLPDDTVVWPGHDYGFKPSSTIGEEKQTNPWLNTGY